MLTFAGTNALARYTSSGGIRRHLPLEGKAERTAFAPNTETFSAVHNISVGCRSRLARSPGGLGGRSRIEFIVSPLSRRRHNESHFAAEPPECAFLAKPFFVQAKNGVNSGRRSHKISVGKTKPDSEPSPRRGSQIWCNFPRAKRGEKRGKAGDDRMKNPCYTVTARDEIPRWHCGAAGNLSASGRNTSLRTVLPKALFRRLPTGRFRRG